MKKLTLCMVTLFVVMVAASAYALPLWDGGGFTYDGRDYTVWERVGAADTYYDDDYFGWTGGDYTGYYLGTIEGNTEPDGLWDAITYYYYERWTEDIALSASYKVENGTGKDGPLNVVANDPYSGTWAMDDLLLLGFYAVKGADEFALYYVDPAEQEGIWTTRHLLTGGATVPGISHFSAVPTTQARVPEPAALIWLGFGLLGLAGASKPFLKK